MIALSGPETCALSGRLTITDNTWRQESRKSKETEWCVNNEISHFEKEQSLVSFENFKEGNFPTDREVDIDCHGAEVRRAEENIQSLSSGKTL